MTGVKKTHQNTHKAPVLNERGYSLIELVIVLAVITLAFTIVVPLAGSVYYGSRVSSAAGYLAAALTKAQALAKSTYRTVPFAINTADNSWQFANQVDRLQDNVELSIDIRAKANRAARRQFVFYPDGSSSGGHIIVQLNSHRSQVRVEKRTGRISVHGM